MKELNEEDGKRLAQLSSLVSNGVLHYDEWSVKDALNGEIEKLNNFNSSKKVVQHSDEQLKSKDSTKKDAKNKDKKKADKIEKEVEKPNKEPKQKKKLFGNKNKGIDISMEDESSNLNDNEDDEDLLS